MSEFRNAFGQTVFNQKYKHEGCETWAALANTLVEDVCGDLVPEKMKDRLKSYITDFKFIPGGRYLYYAGRPAKFYNNCFRGDTNVLTDEGWVRLDTAVGETIHVISPVADEYLPAEVVHHGKQMVNRIVFRPVRGRSAVTWERFATANHRWVLLDGSITEDLSVGDVVPGYSWSDDHQVDPMWFARGFIFGDGQSADGSTAQLRLCSDKHEKHLSTLRLTGCSVTYPESADGDPVLYFKRTEDGYTYKTLPDVSDMFAHEIGSFIRGWLAADGPNNSLSSVVLTNLEWFVRYAAFAGIVVTGKIRSQTRDVQIGDYRYPEHTIYMVNWRYGDEWQGFKVVSITPEGEEDVYCPSEPVHGQIVIDDGMVTGNCFMLRAEEDTREEWANIFWRATSCLMTGGGIGIDYSRFRGEGVPLTRTGGTASGPLPAMEAVNEIGRRVMQGGSRRSAIYASLNWQHSDAGRFLISKNWHEQRTPGGLTVSECKERDFNYHAPLECTNISLNYDDAWLNKPQRELDPTFLLNVRQALQTAEPGFSFNFGDKQDETLRNACCELTSRDDSDVCNLGSINVANVGTIEEFEQIVSDATLFLLCGTFRADLPYARVYEVREKNRRLGLGLMGMHEWLLQRGYRYEVTEELHEWLAIYRDASDSAAAWGANALNCNVPVGKRAIAPTGSIGILAGTTTGIEPIFATAYKRRYLREKRWHVQHVIDGSARAIIEATGANPSAVESAVELAADPERRIKFQADVQDYVDHAISSTINLPAWGSPLNNECRVESFARILSKYAPRLRGFTCYPDGARGGQPIVPVDYKYALAHEGKEFEEGGTDICEITGKGGTCGS